MYHDVILKAEHDAMKAWSDADKALYWVEHAGYDAVKLVEQCWDFLEAVANHPAAAADKAIKAWASAQTVQKAEETGAVAASYADDLISSVEKLF